MRSWPWNRSSRTSPNSFTRAWHAAAWAFAGTCLFSFLLDLHGRSARIVCVHLALTEPSVRIECVYGCLFRNAASRISDDAARQDIQQDVVRPAFIVPVAEILAKRAAPSFPSGHRARTACLGMLCLWLPCTPRIPHSLRTARRASSLGQGSA